MAVLKNDRVEVLEYLKRSVERMRQLALVNPDKFGGRYWKLPIPQSP
jgi:hypothetical protein